MSEQTDTRPKTGAWRRRPRGRAPSPTGRGANRMPFHKYRPFQPIGLSDRQWPSRTIERAPRWCSVDLRDGNQALIDPMSVDEKLRLWQLLLDVGFSEIEVGIPGGVATGFRFHPAHHRRAV